MPLRMTGMMSGLDTESIIQDLVQARREKVNVVKKAQIRLDWKQNAWKDLNSKLRNLQSKFLGNMRFVSSYSKKKTVVSNSNAVSIITGENAVNGVQSLKIKQLAKTGYLTGAKVEGKNGDLTALSKLGDLKDGITGDGTISVKAGDKSVDIHVNADTTISDVLTQIKSVGLNANFDAKNQRFFISAKESGAASDFSITAQDENGAKALSSLGLQVNLADDKATLAEYQKYAGYYVAGDRDATLANMQGMIDSMTDSRTKGYLEQYQNLKTSREAAQKKIDELNTKYADNPLQSADDYKTQLEEKAQQIKELEEAMKDTSLSPEEMREKEEQLMNLKQEEADLKILKADAETLAKQNETVAKLDEQIAGVQECVTITEETAEDGKVTYRAAATDKLIQEVQDHYYAKAEYAAQIVTDYENGISLAGSATKVNGQDAIIYLNDAEFTSSGNTFEINGLTITALNETKDGEEITVTTQDDTDGIYDMIKDFLKEYNSVVNEMDKLYNADAAKGYDPLLNEEKDAMSDSEVEEWEKKVKDSLLRRDDTVSGVNSALQMLMSAGIEINGKRMYLSDFGIDTQGYFEAKDNEKHAYHIDGDPDDEMTGSKPDKLKSMIANDPSTVISFFSKLSQSMYKKMDELSSSVKDYRSYGSFFDDKKMKTDYADYNRKIADMEAKLAKYEDKWYKKFSVMETTLAKMQSNASAITGLLGG